MITIIPYEAVGQIRFGMSMEEVIASLGPPHVTDTNRSGEVVPRYEGQRLTIASEGLVEVSILPSLAVDVLGVNVFSDPDAFAELCLMDGDPQEVVGFIVLLNLGIMLTGFHDLDESQKALTAFARGRLDFAKLDMKPFPILER